MCLTLWMPSKKEAWWPCFLYSGKCFDIWCSHLSVDGPQGKGFTPKPQQRSSCGCSCLPTPQTWGVAGIITNDASLLRRTHSSNSYHPHGRTWPGKILTSLGSDRLHDSFPPIRPSCLGRGCDISASTAVTVTVAVLCSGRGISLSFLYRPIRPSHQWESLQTKFSTHTMYYSRTWVGFKTFLLTLVCL